MRAVYWLIANEMEGAVNVCAPDPLPNEEFMRVLRQEAGINFGIPTRQWMLEIGARLLNTETELVLKSRRVEPGRLLEAGFEFEFEHWRDAARDLMARIA